MENMMENNEFEAQNNGGIGLKEDLNAMKDKVADRAVNFKEKISDRATQKIDSARSKASERLKATSTRIQDLATYVEEHDARDMSQAVAQTSKDYIKENPGKSMLVGMVVGLLVGRILSMGNHNHAHRPHHPQSFYPYSY